MPVTQWDFLASALLHLQPGLGMQAIHALVVHDLTRLAQLQIDHAGDVSAMALSQGDDLLLECAITVSGGFVTQNTDAHAEDAQGSTLTKSGADHVAHQFASGWYAHQFFLKASFVTSFSSMASASSRLRRAFSVSNSFRRLASDTFMPPNLLRQR